MVQLTGTLGNAVDVVAVAAGRPCTSCCCWGSASLELLLMYAFSLSLFVSVAVLNEEEEKFIELLARKMCL